MWGTRNGFGWFGVHVNPTKCELNFCSKPDHQIISKFLKISPGIRNMESEVELLSAGLSTKKLLSKKTEMVR